MRARLLAALLLLALPVASAEAVVLAEGAFAFVGAGVLTVPIGQPAGRVLHVVLEMVGESPGALVAVELYKDADPWPSPSLHGTYGLGGEGTPMWDEWRKPPAAEATAWTLAVEGGGVFSGRYVATAE